jgi:hypothetical protein
MGIMTRLKDALRHGWNAFRDDDPLKRVRGADGASFSHRPDRVVVRYSSEKSIVSSIFTRLSIDAAALDIRHVRVDDEGRYQEDINSDMNKCFLVEPNKDQGPRHFRQDILMTLFNEGVCAVVPVDTSLNPNVTAGFDIQSMRVARILGWMPEQVMVELYDDRPEKGGVFRQLTLDKKFVAIIENPLYAVMNQTNSTLRRLERKLSLLDAVDEASSSGKLDIIIQLPYVIKSEARREAARQRRLELENQLAGSKYGVAYTDGTEKVVQLNRPAENNLLKQVEWLTNMVYAQLGLTPDVMNGTADEAAMLHYYDRTIEPLVSAIVEAMRRSFLSKTARAQGQWIQFFRNPFKLAPLKDMAEIADKFTRNEIVTGNEFRSFLGIKPSKDPKADELHNSNMPEPTPAPSEPTSTTRQGGDSQNGS